MTRLNDSVFLTGYKFVMLLVKETSPFGLAECHGVNNDKHKHWLDVGCWSKLWMAGGRVVLEEIIMPGKNLVCLNVHVLMCTSFCGI